VSRVDWSFFPLREVDAPSVEVGADPRVLSRVGAGGRRWCLGFISLTPPGGCRKGVGKKER